MVLELTPPDTLKEGEYWARIFVTGRPRKQLPSLVATQEQAKSGVIVLNQISLPFHYRKGRVTTGVQIDNFKAVQDSQAIDIAIDITRRGNASFWGMRKYRLINQSGKVVFTIDKNTVVYRSFKIRERVEFGNISPGNYTLSVEFVTYGRADIRKEDLVQSPPLVQSMPISIR